MVGPYRQYLIFQSLVGAVINLILNIGIGVFLYGSLTRVPLEGSPSVLADIVVTSFLLPPLICLIATPLIRIEAHRGRVPIPDPLTGFARALGWLPGSLALRAVALGVLAGTTLGPLTGSLFWSLGITGLDFRPFLAFKALYAAALAAIVTPLVAARAVADALPRASASSPHIRR